MLKTVYEKWEDVKTNNVKGKNYIAEYYLGKKS